MRRVRRSVVVCASAIAIAGCSLVRAYPEPVEEAGPELCANHLDDDLDGDTDCDEIACDGYCPTLPAAPADGPEIACPVGWSGGPLVSGPVADGAPAWTARWCVRPPATCATEGSDRAEHVDASAEPGGDGSSERPHRTIADAIAEATAPGGASLVVVAPGRYAERVAPQADLEIRGACGLGAVSWSAPDDRGLPLIQLAGVHLTLSGVQLLPAGAPAIALEEGGALDGHTLTIGGMAPLVVAGIGSAVGIAGLDVEASGDEPAIVARAGSSVRLEDAALRGSIVIAGENAAVRLDGAQVEGAISVRGAAGRLDAVRTFVHAATVIVAEGSADVSESAFRDGARLSIDAGASIEIDRVALVDGAQVGAGADVRLEASRVAWARGPACALRTAGADLALSDATLEANEAGDDGDAAICIEAGLARLERIAIANAAGGAIRVGAGSDVTSLTDVDVAGACSSGCGAGGGAIRIEGGSSAIWQRAHVARTDGCALSWDRADTTFGLSLFLEGNRRALCGPDVESVLAIAVLLDNEADLEVDGVARCAPERSRGCGTPFAR